MRFFYHYNKPASKEAGGVRLTLHFRDTCHIIKGLTCLVPTNTRSRKTSPHCVIVGEANQIKIHHCEAHIE